MKRFFILMCIVSNLALAEPRLVDAGHDDFVHFTAHVGASYILNTTTYALFHKGLGASRNESLYFSILTTLLLSATYKFVESNGPVNNFGKSMLQNSIGIGLSAVTIFTFDL